MRRQPNAADNPPARKGTTWAQKSTMINTQSRVGLIRLLDRARAFAPIVERQT